jgi:poly-gamma-glutamate synthesis protein (capsule biosynthesis protein)
MTAETAAVFTALWGEPAAGAVEMLAADELVDAAWAQRPSWGLVPFEALEPLWKVLAVDGQSPIWKEFEPADYALNVPIGLVGEAGLVDAVLEALTPLNNRDAGKLTTVALTGVTALVRSTAWQMNRDGITYPAEDIGPVLRAADITHVSNEVPFWDECGPPDPVQRGLVFCSDPRHFELLEAIGVDVVELTGDHFNDYGQEAMLYTLDLYDEHDLPYYGGGHNQQEARQALLMEHNGNRIAFIGCNGKQGYATASDTLAGAVQCDYEWLSAEVARLSAEGILVIATFQHNEVYTFIPQPGLIRDFGVPAAAGASIVSGSQAHQSHGMAFADSDTLVMFGLGNLFFDQKGVVDNGDRALIARHVFYDGRYLSTELLTIQFIDYAKPRFMTPEERAEFLQILFDASIWNE